MPANGSAPSRINRRPAPWRSLESLVWARRNAATATSCSPSSSRISASVNQAEVKFGASSIACSRQIALQLQVAGKLEPAVGHQIAGGEKKTGRHGFRNFCHCRAHPGNPSKTEDSQEMYAQVKPA